MKTSQKRTKACVVLWTTSQPYYTERELCSAPLSIGDKLIKTQITRNEASVLPKIIYKYLIGT